MFRFWFTYWIRRPSDFELTLGLLLIAAVASLPFWLWLARRMNKQTVFVIGTSWWLWLLFAVEPDWSRGTVLLVAIAAGVGFAATDTLPWSMLGDVIDADEIETRERRECIYAGTFSFLRKLAGASAVSLGSIGLEFAGYLKDGPEPASALLAIRLLVGIVPAIFLTFALWIVRGYTLDRATHAQIRVTLDARAEGRRR
jgi:GPH family glycoside/pentoside/hexuronide:cation symporter